VNIRRSQKIARPQSQQGFTLLEMIVVLVIIGLIMGLVGPSLFNQADKAKVQTAGTQIKMLKGSLLTYRLDVGRMPTTNEGLVVLKQPPSDEAKKPFWKGPYIDGDIPLDPWNNAYKYDAQASTNGQPFSLYSYGADGVQGGEGYNTDVGYLPAK